jgi:plastocyanin
VVVIIVAAAAGAYYFLSSGSGHRTVTVNIPNGTGSNQALSFSPGSITVVIGVNNTIMWVNQDSVAHTVTSNSFNSGNLNAGASFTVTLTTPGQY